MCIAHLSKVLYRDYIHRLTHTFMHQWQRKPCKGQLMLSYLHVADAAVMRPGWLWNDAFLTDGHRRDVSFVLRQHERYCKLDLC